MNFTLSLVEYDGEGFISVTLGTESVRCKILHNPRDSLDSLVIRKLFNKIISYITD